MIVKNIFIIICFLFLGCAGGPGKDICINNACVRAELADSALKRRQGLMFRKGLDKDAGMLFLFDQEARHSFWMKNMNFPLDIIWVSRDKKVVDVKTDVAPCDGACEGLIPQEAAQYVLEVNAGFVRKNQIKIGGDVKF